MTAGTMNTLCGRGFAFGCEYASAGSGRGVRISVPLVSSLAEALYHTEGPYQD